MEPELMELICIIFALITFCIVVYQDKKGAREEAEKKLAKVLGGRR